MLRNQPGIFHTVLFQSQSSANKFLGAEKLDEGKPVAENARVIVRRTAHNIRLTVAQCSADPDMRHSSESLLSRIDSDVRSRFRNEKVLFRRLVEGSFGKHPGI